MIYSTLNGSDSTSRLQRENNICILRSAGGATAFESHAWGVTTTRTSANGHLLLLILGVLKPGRDLIQPNIHLGLREVTALEHHAGTFLGIGNVGQGIGF